MNFKDIYEHKQPKNCCDKCVWFGEIEGGHHTLCVKDFPNIKEADADGCCSAFSKTARVIFMKYHMLKKMGFKFKNKVR